MKRYNVYATIVILSNILLSFLMIYEVFLFRSLIDHALAHEVIRRDIITIIIVILIMVSFQFISLFLKSKYYLSLELELKKRLFISLYKADYQSIMRIHSAKVLSLYLDDIRTICDTKCYYIPQLISQISRIILAFLAIIRLNYLIILFLTIVGAIMLLLSSSYGRYVKKINKEVLESNDNLNSYLEETYQNLKFLNVMSDANTVINKTDEELQKNYQIKAKRNNLQSGTNGFVTSTMLILYALVMCYSAYLIYQNKISYGTLTALVSLVSYFEAPFSQIGSFLSKFSLFRVSSSRVDSILRLPSEEAYDQIEDFSKIVLDHISFSYNQKQIYNKFSLEINKNDIIYIKGPSGCGKSTLINILLGFLKYDGDAYVLSENRRIKIGYKTRGLFSYVPQENILFSGTIRDNFKFLNEAILDEEIIEALKKTNVYDELQNGIDYQIYEHGRGLSVGQIQRILIAMALVKKRPILIMDEFSSALDRNNEEEIALLLSRLNKTIIFVSHRDINLEAKVIDLEDINENN